MSCLIIAEAGVNHNGSLNLAKEMALKAKQAGADIVKYQTAVPELVISRFAPKAEYQKELTGEKESQLEMVKRIHFGFDEHRELCEYCKQIGIEYLSAPFDIPSAEFLNTLDMRYFKIPSGEIDNLPLLETIAAFGAKIILSTGMSNIAEIENAVKILKNGGAAEVILLHCNTEYPTMPKDANLSAMLDIRDKLGLLVGYSDHTLGIEADIAAVALGACVIEKHFTLDKNMEGPDHKASLDVNELGEMVKAIRKTELLLGEGTKVVSQSESKNKPIARKSIVAMCAIKKGDEFTKTNLTTKRPANGVSPMMWHSVIGKIAKRDYGSDEMIDSEEVK